MRKKKRSSINIEEVAEYSREYSEVLTALPWSRVLNMDETPFNFVFLRGEVLAEKGAESVQAELPDDYRKSFTVIATITADGGKFPPLFLATGKTKVSHRQFAEMKSSDSDYFIYHSPGGRTNEDVMEFYFSLVE